jgi:hypothetical protein
MHLNEIMMRRSISVDQEGWATTTGARRARRTRATRPVAVRVAEQRSETGPDDAPSRFPVWQAIVQGLARAAGQA